MADSVEARAKKIAGLRELLDFLEAHPDIPLPLNADLEYCVTGVGTDPVTGKWGERPDHEGVAEIARVAGLLDAEVKSSGGCTETARRFGAASYRAFFVDMQRSRDWDALVSYRDSIKAD